MSSPPGFEALSQGIALYANGKFKEALRKIEESLFFLQGMDTPHLMRAQALSALGRIEDALEELTKFPFPENAQWHAQLTTAYSKSGLHQEALDAAARAIESAPEDSALWYRKGCAELRASSHSQLDIGKARKLSKQAKLSLEKALSLNPENYMALLELGSMLRFSDPNKSNIFAQAALDLRFGDPRMHMLAAELAIDRREFDEAGHHLEIIVGAEPGNKNAKNELHRLKRLKSSILHRIFDRVEIAFKRHELTHIFFGGAIGLLCAILKLSKPQLALSLALIGAVVAICLRYNMWSFRQWAETPKLSKKY